MIKLAKTYLSRFLALLCVVSFSGLGISAQVPEGSKAAQEPREEKAPRFVGRECTLTPDGYIGPESGPNSNCACGDELWEYDFGPLCIPQRFSRPFDFLCPVDSFPIAVNPDSGNGPWWECGRPSLDDWTLFEDVTELEFVVSQSAAEIRFSWDPLQIEFVSDDGNRSTILFTEEGVTYSGDIPLDESTKMFFDLFWKKYILEQHLKAKCEQTHKEKR